MTDTTVFRPAQRSKSKSDGSVIVKDKIDGSLHIFNAADGTKRVRCEECGASIGQRQATRHYDSHQVHRSAPQNPTHTSDNILQDRGDNDHSRLLVGQVREPLQSQTDITDAGPSAVRAPAKVRTTTDSSISDSYHNQNHASSALPSHQDADVQLPPVLLANKQGETEEQYKGQKRDLLEAFCGDLTVEMMLSSAKCAKMLPYMLRGPGVLTTSFMSKGFADHLQATIPEDHRLSIYPVCNSNDISNHPTVPDGYEDASNQDHIAAITQGGTLGMERLVGAIIATGDRQTKILCNEHYFRDKALDPHAESEKTHHTSVPDKQLTSQYPETLKIIVIPDKFNNPHLVIGTSAGNYLVTMSEEDGQIKVGPSRCGAFKVSEHTRLLVSLARQDQSLLDHSVFGLAQVRTGFGHPVTYSTRRAIAVVQSHLKTMPITVFTLHQWNIPGTKVFHQLYTRSQEENADGIILKRSDVDDAPLAGKIAECLAELSNLFMDDKLNVTNNPKAESILQGLAKLFSRTISDKNRVVADYIEKAKKTSRSKHHA